MDSDGEIVLGTKKNASAHDIHSIMKKYRETSLWKIDDTQVLSASEQWRLERNWFADCQKISEFLLAADQELEEKEK